MDYVVKRQSAKNFTKDIAKGKYSMKHKFQRQENQWGNRQKSLLIDSMLRPYPIDPIRCEVGSDDVRRIFDGVQRATTVRDFFKKDGFRLAKNLKPVTVDGEVYEIAGKKYAQLDEAVQDKLNDYEMTIYVFTDCTGEDIREMFTRQNNGKPLNNTQKRTAIESEKVSDVIFSLADHEFFEKVLSAAQYKKDVQRDLVRETLMLINTDEENDFTSFRAKDIDSFVIWYAENINAADISTLTDVLDALNTGDTIKVKSTSIPMILYGGYKCLKDSKDFRKFSAAVDEFIENYDVNEEYKQLVQSGTTSSAGVKARLQYWNNIVENL
jgi:hypothetical protein